MKTIYQLYITDAYSTTQERKTLGVFNKIPQALTQLVKHNGHILLDVFAKHTSLYVESMVLGEYDNSTNCFDSVNDDDMIMLKKIIFFEALEIWKSQLGCLTESPEELGFDPEDIEEWDDVSDALALQFLADDNYDQFIRENLVE